jgi:hypothetical protein
MARRGRSCHVPAVVSGLRHDWHVLKALRTAGTRVAAIVGRNVLLKVTALLALAALAAYILTRAASGRGLAWGDWLDHYHYPGPYPPFAVFPLLPPGRWSVAVRDVEDHPMQGRYGAEVAFTDRAGRHWIRRATGALEELDISPMEFLSRGGLGGPYDFVSPTPEA